MTVPSKLRSEATCEFGEHDPADVMVHAAGLTLVRVTTAYAVGLVLTSSLPLW